MMRRVNFTLQDIFARIARRQRMANRATRRHLWARAAREYRRAARLAMCYGSLDSWDDYTAAARLCDDRAERVIREDSR